MAYRFLKNEALPHAIRRVFAEEIDWAVGQLTNSKNRREAIHEARKSVKKIRALLAFIRRPLGQKYKSQDRHFQKAGRLLSELRDAQVVLDVFDGMFAKDGEIDASARRDIRHNLERSKPKARDERQVAARAARLLTDARPIAGEWPIEGIYFNAVLPDVVAGYKRGRTELRQARRAGTAEAFHSFRKAVKKHWYQLKLLQNVWDPEMKQRAADLRDLETCLGDGHNLTVLRQRIEADVETRSDRRHAQRFMARLDDQAQKLRRRALENGHQLYAAKPREFGQALAKLRVEPQTLRKGPGAAALKASSAVA
jgi:CHAD domain-containing protein